MALDTARSHSVTCTMRSLTVKICVLLGFYHQLAVACGIKQNFSWLSLTVVVFRQIYTSLAFLLLDIFSALTSRHCQVRVITLDAQIFRQRSWNNWKTNSVIIRNTYGLDQRKKIKESKALWANPFILLVAIATILSKTPPKNLFQTWEEENNCPASKTRLAGTATNFSNNSFFR